MADKTKEAPVTASVSAGKKKFAHGALALAVTAVVIAFVILFNVAFFLLAKNSRWYIDMTKYKVFSLSDETKEILKDVKSDVDIIFAKDEEALMSGSGTNGYMKYIYSTAKELEKEFSNIHVKCIDIIKNPGSFDYYYNTAATNILTTSVIVDSGGEFRLFTSDAFMVFDENRTYVWGYNGEAKFAAAILQVTSSDMPTICFTEGHGEPSLDECRAFRELCESAGYNVKTIDLSTEEISDDVRIIVINDPLYDFAGVEKSTNGNEIDKLTAFLDDYGCVMVFTDPERSKNLTNLSELLVEWGVGLNPGSAVSDPLNSISVDGRTFYAEYETEDTLGASLYSAISKLSSKPRPVFSNAMPLEVLYDTYSVPMGTFQASAALYTSDGAKVIENGKEVSSGKSALMTITRKEGIKDNDYIYAYLLACGSAEFVTDEYLTAGVGRDILFNTIRLTGREKIVADIDLKMFEDTNLTVTTHQTNVITAVFAVVIPLAVAAVGAVVCLRRRRT